MTAKQKKRIGIVVGILVVLLVGCLLWSLWKAEMTEEPSGDALSSQVILRERHTSYETSTEQVDIVIPEFDNLDMTYEAYINQKMREDLEIENVYAEMTEGYASGEIGFFTYETTYERYNVEDYVSIVVNQYIHLGEGRPRIQKKCYVVDAKNQMSPSLQDIFVNKIDYREAILAEINQQAEKNQIELVGGNGLKTIKDTQPYYIRDGKLVLYFESSEIAATAVGELEFTMPFEMVNGKFVLPNENR